MKIKKYKRCHIILKRLILEDGHIDLIDQYFTENDRLYCHSWLSDCRPDVFQYFFYGREDLIQDYFVRRQKFYSLDGLVPIFIIYNNYQLNHFIFHTLITEKIDVLLILAKNQNSKKRIHQQYGILL